MCIRDRDRRNESTVEQFAITQREIEHRLCRQVNAHSRTHLRHVDIASPRGNQHRVLILDPNLDDLGHDAALTLFHARTALNKDRNRRRCRIDGAIDTPATCRLVSPHKLWVTSAPAANVVAVETEVREDPAVLVAENVILGHDREAIRLEIAAAFRAAGTAVEERVEDLALPRVENLIRRQFGTFGVSDVEWSTRA